MRSQIFHTGLTLCFLIMGVGVAAQYALEDFDLDGDIGKWYDQSLGLEQAGVVLGEYYKLERASIKSHPYFLNPQWLPGRIWYRGNEYDSLYILYDISEDLLLMRHPRNDKYLNLPIKLIQDQVERFELAGHTFKYFPQSVLNIEPGFFDLLYVGDQLDLIVKRVKEPRWNGVINFDSADAMALRYGNQYIRFRRKHQLFELFPAHRKKIKKFVRDNTLKPNLSYEPDLVSVIRFCDQLSQNRNL